MKEVSLEECLGSLNASPTCELCNKKASSRCGACAAHTDVKNVTSYCSKACQKADWQSHKTICRMRIFYARVRDLETRADKSDPTAFGRAVLTESKPLKIDLLNTNYMALYHMDVALSVRPQFLEGKIMVKDEVREEQLRANIVFRNADRYMADYDNRASELEQYKMTIGKGFEVRYDRRPFHKLQDTGVKADGLNVGDLAAVEPHDTEESVRGGKAVINADLDLDNELVEKEPQTAVPSHDSSSRKGALLNIGHKVILKDIAIEPGAIEMFVQDYKQLSFEDWVARFADSTQRFGSNPFGIPYVKLNKAGMALFKKGALEGQMVGDDIFALLRE